MVKRGGRGFAVIDIYMKITLIIFSVALFTTYSFSQPKKHVVVLGFDGMGGMGVQNTSTPHFDFIKQNGSHTYKARSVFPTVSSPNWAAMINGANPKVNRVFSNDWEREKIADKCLCGHKKGEIFPTIFKVIRDQNPDAVIDCVYDWDGFARLANTESMNVSLNAAGEYDACSKACDLIAKDKPDFLFVHFDHVDHAGHAYGHFTEEYYKSIQLADSLTGVVIQALKDAGIFDDTYILITADHGGIHKGHGGATAREMQIPWMITGRGIRKNFTIHERVRQFDTAPTIAHILGLKQPDCWIGQPVKSIY